MRGMRMSPGQPPENKSLYPVGNTLIRTATLVALRAMDKHSLRFHSHYETGQQDYVYSKH